METNEKLNNLIEERIQIKNQVDSFSEKLENINNEIKLELEILGKEFYENEMGQTVSYKETTRNGFDSKKAKTFLSEEQLKECEKKTVFKTLRVLNSEQNEKVKRFIENSKNKVNLNE